MNSIKQHISLIVPLLALLFGLESMFLINRSIAHHENELSRGYSIIIASTKPIEFSSIKNIITNATELNRMSSEYMTSSLRNEIDKDVYQELQKELPYFYALKLLTFPNKAQLEYINDILTKIPGVIKVETFNKSHSHIFNLLLIIKGAIMVFSVCTAVLSVLLMVKQIEVWRLQHGERIEIMGFLGAPFWTRNDILFRLAIIDSIIASLISIGALIYLKDSTMMLDITNILGTDSKIINVIKDGFMLFGSAIIVSLASVLFVIFRQKII